MEDSRDCLTLLLKNKNKGLSFNEWNYRKTLESCRVAQTFEVECCVANLFDRLVQNANKNSQSCWLKKKKAETKKIEAKQRNEEVCLKVIEHELAALKRNYSNKAFKTWLKRKEKETKKNDLRIKEDEACNNMCDEYFYSLKCEYNKKAVKDWLHRLKARQIQGNNRFAASVDVDRDI